MKMAYDNFKENLCEACGTYAEENYRMLSANKEHVEFSRSFIERMKKLIQKVEVHYRSLHREKRRLFFTTALNKAAMILLITMAVSVTVTMSVDAARNTVIDFLVEFFDDHIRITSSNMDPDGEYDIAAATESGEDMLDVYVERLENAGYTVATIREENGVSRCEVTGLNKFVLSRQVFDSYVVGTIHRDDGKKAFTIKDIDIYELNNGDIWYWYVQNSRYQLVMELCEGSTKSLFKVLFDV